MRSGGWTKGGREARGQSIRPSLWKDGIVDAPPVKVLPSEASRAESLEVRWLKSWAYASKRPVGDWLEESDASGRRTGTKEEESASFQAGDERENAEHSLHAARCGKGGKRGKGVWVSTVKRASPRLVSLAACAGGGEIMIAFCDSS